MSVLGHACGWTSVHKNKHVLKSVEVKTFGQDETAQMRVFLFLPAKHNFQSVQRHETTKGGRRRVARRRKSGLGTRTGAPTRRQCLTHPIERGTVTRTLSPDLRPGSERQTGGPSALLGKTGSYRKQMAIPVELARGIGHRPETPGTISVPKTCSASLWRLTRSPGGEATKRGLAPYLSLYLWARDSPPH